MRVLKAQGQVRLLVDDASSLKKRRNLKALQVHGQSASTAFDGLVDALLVGSWVCETLEEARQALTHPKIEHLPRPQGRCTLTNIHVGRR